MTEYCLVPRKIANEILKSIDDKDVRKENLKTDPRFENNTPSYRQDVTEPRSTFSRQNVRETNPPLDHLIDLLVDDKFTGYAKSVVKYFQEHPSVRYDTEGYISTPTIGLNLMDVIQFFITGKIDSGVKERIKLMNDFVHIPPYYIKHKNAKEFMYEKVTTKPNRVEKKRTLDKDVYNTPPSTPDATTNKQIRMPRKKRKLNFFSDNDWTVY